MIIQHGRHATCATSSVQLLQWPCTASVPEVPSYQGYDGLGRNLASHGMVVVSIGANGINANDGFLDDGGASARAQLILEHLRRWRAWDASASGSPFGTRFVGHIDLDQIGLMGHSRGGEGIAAAVQLNQRSAVRFGIRAALALAPVDFGRRVIGGVELGVVLPYCDGDVSDLQGASYYDDGRYSTPGDTSSKMTALLYGANHNFFNTVWTTGPGSFDDADFRPADRRHEGAGSGRSPCQPGGPGRLTAAQQYQAGTALMAGFLRRTLQPEPALQRFVTGTAPYPASTGPARWSIAYHAAGPPRRGVLGQPRHVPAARLRPAHRHLGAAQRSRLQPEGRARLRPARWRAGGHHPVPYWRPHGRRQRHRCPRRGLGAPGAAVRQPLGTAGVDVSGYDGVRMRVAVPHDSRNTSRAKQDFSVVLEDADGARASVPAAAGTNGLQRLNPGNVQHALLNGLRLPLSSFTAIDLTRVRAVELRFDRTGRRSPRRSPTWPSPRRAPGRRRLDDGRRAHHPAQSFCRRSSANRWACAPWARLRVGPRPLPTVGARASLAAGYADRRDASRPSPEPSAVLNPEATDLVHHAQFLQAFVQDEIDAEWLDSVLTPPVAGSTGTSPWSTAGFAFAGTSPAVATPAEVVEAAYEIDRSAGRPTRRRWPTGPQGRGGAVPVRSRCC